MARPLSKVRSGCVGAGAIDLLDDQAMPLANCQLPSVPAVPLGQLA